jgi:hypothetical protein
MKFALLVFLGLVPLGQAGSPGYFIPEHRISGIGAAREGITDDLLAVRTDRMVEAQTFIILREVGALAGAKRVTSDAKLQAVFRSAAARSGLPKSTLEAIAYLESWGEARAESWAGSPKGIMQISQATARDMGLKVVQTTRYRVTKEKVLVKSSPKPKYKTVTHRVPYKVTGRDDRLVPERAVPAAAVYLAGMEQKFGGRDWAIFAYHCGQGCVGEMQELARRALGSAAGQPTVPRMFFAASPARNRELYLAIQQQMWRDYSPTYYFRVLCAEQLLTLYRNDPDAFTALYNEYRSRFGATARAPYRLSVWLKPEDMVFHTSDDIRMDVGKRLARAFDRPDYFGYELRLAPDLPANVEYFSQASPAAIGTLAYLAFETRRLYEQMIPQSQPPFQPLPVTALVKPEQFAAEEAGREGLAHSSGQVFDISYGGLPPGEIECLRFVLDDMEWDGYLGFVEEGHGTLHVGCSPTSRDFFTSVFEEASTGAGVATP